MPSPAIDAKVAAGGGHFEEIRVLTPPRAHERPRLEKPRDDSCVEN
jgi:hypothetical protein